MDGDGGRETGGGIGGCRLAGLGSGVEVEDLAEEGLDDVLVDLSLTKVGDRGRHLLLLGHR